MRGSSDGREGGERSRAGMISEESKEVLGLGEGKWKFGGRSRGKKISFVRMEMKKVGTGAH